MLFYDYEACECGCGEVTLEKKKNNKRARVCVYVGGCELMLAAACSAIQVCGNCNCSEIQ